MIIGKEQPASIELEEFVLGSIIIESNSFDLVSSFLKHEHFYKHEYSLIYKAITNLATDNKPIDLLTIAQQVKINGDLETVGGYYTLSTLTNKVASAMNIEAHARIIVQNYLKRRLIDFGYRLCNMAYEDTQDCFDLIDYAGTEINNMINVVESKQIKRLDELTDSVLEDCFTALTTDKQTGVPISISQMQKQTNGWRKGNLIILAARPAMGKTAVALDYAYYPAKLKIPIGLFSLEMTGKELASRLMAKESYISSQKINNNIVNDTELTSLRKDCKVFKDIPLYIDDTPSLSLVRLRSKALRMKREFNIQMIIIDYLQLMEGADSDNREQEISKISRGLKKLAKELDLPIIALSQLSRQVESRPNKMPQLSDLRDSGAIEQDADMVIFLMRPEYYNMETVLYDGQEIPTKDLLLKIIAKYRGGVTGEIRVKWNGETTSISDYNKINNEIENIKPIQNNTNFLNDNPF